MENKLPWAIDFDGTLATNVWETDPEGIGEPIWDMIDAVRKVHKKNERIVIWSSRPSWHEERVRKWLHLHDVPFDTLLVGLKLLAVKYVDDKAMLPEEFVKRVNSQV